MAGVGGSVDSSCLSGPSNAARSTDTKDDNPLSGVFTEGIAR